MALPDNPDLCFYLKYERIDSNPTLVRECEINTLVPTFDALLKLSPSIEEFCEIFGYRAVLYLTPRSRKAIRSVFSGRIDLCLSDDYRRKAYIDGIFSPTPTRWTWVTKCEPGRRGALMSHVRDTCSINGREFDILAQGDSWFASREYPEHLLVWDEALNINKDGFVNIYTPKR